MHQNNNYTNLETSIFVAHNIYDMHQIPEIALALSQLARDIALHDKVFAKINQSAILGFVGLYVLLCYVGSLCIGNL